MHLGIIGDIDEIKDEVVRFYSFTGYCVSTSAGIEHMLFQCYYAAGDIRKNDAVSKFYGSKNFTSYEAKRELADKAVRSSISNPGTIQSWNEIISEIDMVTGANGARNVLGHNPLSLSAYASEGDVDRPFSFELAVSRNSNEAVALNRSARTVNLKSVREEACALNKVQIVRRHINWNRWRPDLREDLAHLVDHIKRRICGIASAGSSSFSV
ncbi:MAG: hypothetical protein HQ494_07765 [Rhodospirillales bacterium]|nr:hypothetical protein [Rhodospirillales bacterium]